MSEYPKVISVDGINVTVESAADEKHWRGQAEAPVSAPEPAPIHENDLIQLPPDGFPPEHQPEPEPDEPKDDAPKKKAPSHTHKGLGDKKK